MKHSAYRTLPLVYSCSGCSSAAQLANHVALRMDRMQLAEMSCIAGVGGDVTSLVRTATSDRPIIALDGCELQCVKNCLKRHGVEPALHYTLSALGVPRGEGWTDSWAGWGPAYDDGVSFWVCSPFDGRARSFARPTSGCTDRASRSTR